MREHFAARLDEQFADAAREAHARLYEHLKQSAPELPNNLNDMMPLYHAVVHGCKAGLHQQAFDDVTRPRIQRGNEYFDALKIGSISTSFAAGSHFFEKQWHTPHRSLSDVARESLLHSAGFGLRALGRLQDALMPLEFSIQISIERQNWAHASMAATSLSQLYGTLGNVSGAVSAAERSVELADRSKNEYQRMVRRTTLAAALHAAGTSTETLAAFREAEAIQQKRHPEFPLLYSQAVYQYCELLLESPDSRDEGQDQALARIREVRHRAEKMLGIATSPPPLGLLAIALAQLTLGRTWLLASQEQEDGSALDLAEEHLGESISRLRQAGVQEMLARGLLQRSALWRVRLEISKHDSEISNAERDLSEAESIAERGSMLIFQIEAALERTRLFLALGEVAQAHEKLAEAKRLIKQTEKPYEPHVPDWDGWQPPEYVGVFKKGEMVGYHRRNKEIAALAQAIAEQSASALLASGDSNERRPARNL